MNRTLSGHLERLLIDEPERFRMLDCGIVIDTRCVPITTQEQEHVLRDAVAAPYAHSRRAAVKEAARHHSRAVMLQRAMRAVGEARKTFGDEAVVIDLGCGFGWHWTEAARKHRNVRFALVDFSLMNVHVCRNLMPLDEYPNVLCLQASILDLPLRSGVGSLVWTVQVLQHLSPDDRARALREMRRVLAPGGAFFIAWIRSVPLLRMIYSLLRRPYHTSGRTAYGLYLDRFNRSVAEELLRVFPGGRITFSETLFHPELRLRAGGRRLGALDDVLASTPIAPLIARQAEFGGSL